MNNLAIIDEDDEYREELKESILNIFSKSYSDWNTIDIKPFRKVEDYVSWISENEIRVLLVDQYLDSKSIGKGVHVDYLGSQLVKYLRNFFKDLPIYAITGVPVKDELKDSFKSYNLIISKKELNENEENLVNMFVRAGESFYEKNKKELEQLGILAGKVAKGEATEQDIVNLKTLQTTLSIPYYADTIIDREYHIKEKEKDIKRLEELEQEITELLKNDK